MIPMDSHNMCFRLRAWELLFACALSFSKKFQNQAPYGEDELNDTLEE